MQRFLLTVLLVALTVLLLWWSAGSRARDGAGERAPGPGAASPPARLASPRAHEPAASAAPRAAGVTSVPSREALEPQPGPPAAPLQLRLLDALTGEPVPCYTLRRLRSGEQASETLVSDARGRVSGRVPLEPGSYTLRLVDVEGQSPGDSGESSFLDLEHALAAQDLSVPVGPTYSFEIGSRADLPDRLQVRRIDLASPEGPPTWTVLREPCGDQRLPWARFRELGPSAGQVRLELVGDLGAWSAGALAPAGPGVHPEPVRLLLAALGIVRGRFVSTAAPFEDGADLALTRLDVESPEPRWGRVARDGTFFLGDLDPGRYALEVRDPAVRAEPVTFDLPPGELDLGQLPWTPLPVVGTVRLRVRSPVQIPIDVELERTFAPPRHGPWHSDSWEELPGGGYESALEWEELHAGPLEVHVHAHGLGDWRTSLGVIEPPVLDVVLQLPPARAPLTLHVLDAASGEPLPEWTVLLRGQRAWDEVDARPHLALPYLAPDAALAVIAPDHRAWVADAGSPDWPRADQETLTVRLGPGWSHLVLARSRPGNHPVPGVEILLDGRSCGVTNEHGELWLDREARPRGIEVLHPGWEWIEREAVDLGDSESWVVLGR